MIKQFHNTLLGIAKLCNQDLTPLVQCYNHLYTKRVKSRGKKDTVAFLKGLLYCGERYALHKDITPLPWTKSDSDNFPTVIKVFKPYLQSRNFFKRMLALSVLRSVEDYRLPVSHDIGSVTDPPVDSEELVRQISNFIDKVPWVKPLKLKSLKYHLTLKKGPNGPALATSDSDAAGLVHNYPELFEAIRVVQKKLGGSNHLSEDTLMSETPGIVSKLTQFPEKSGKTRTIAVIDYYSQRALKPLHKALMGLLKTLKSDGTYSHRNVGIWTKQKTLEKSFLFSADLTAATDRFPREIQRALLFKLIPDVDLATALWTLLTERTFTVAWSGETVQYAVGTPMGAYASWAIFSLAHHLTIEFCDQRKNVGDRYRQIGDDYITSNEAQANRYIEVMDSLGVSINNKSMKSPYGSNYSAAEVAKQLFLNGNNLSPLTPGFVKDLMKPHMFNMCLVELRFRYRNLPVTPAVLLKNLFGHRPNIFKRVWLLTSNPWNGAIEPSDEGYNEFSPWISKDLSRFRLELGILRNDLITKKATHIYSKFMDSYMGESDPQPDQEPRTDAQYFLQSELNDEADILATAAFQNESFGNMHEEFNEVDSIQFIIDPADQYKSRKEQRCIAQEFLIENAYKKLPDLDNKGC